MILLSELRAIALSQYVLERKKYVLFSKNIDFEKLLLCININTFLMEKILIFINFDTLSLKFNNLSR